MGQAGLLLLYADQSTFFSPWAEVAGYQVMALSLALQQSVFWYSELAPFALLFLPKKHVSIQSESEYNSPSGIFSPGRQVSMSGAVKLSPFLTLRSTQAIRVWHSKTVLPSFRFLFSNAFSAVFLVLWTEMTSLNGFICLSWYCYTSISMPDTGDFRFAVMEHISI